MRLAETGVCPACGETWVGRVAGRHRIWCSPRCSNAGDNRRRNPLRDVVCPCGKAFQTGMRTQRWCSSECREYHHTVDRNHLRRIGTGRQAPERITVAVLGDRDGWICHLCSAAVDPEARYPDPMSGSIDHVTPVSVGGQHTLANTALAHWICNSVRGARAVA